MTGASSRPMIVAVFGGSSGDSTEVPEAVLELARCAGSTIAAKGLILLTGGRLNKRECPDAVKDAALLGADPDGRWIGVLKEGCRPASEPDGEDSPAFDPDDKGGVIFSHMDHQRNFLEASLCDAAVVLMGGEGTISEAVSTICLGKPVLLAGAAWIERWPALDELFNRRALPPSLETELFTITRAKLRADTTNGPMNELINEALKPGRTRLHERSRLVAAGDVQACPAIADWLEEIRALPRKGEFPPLSKQYDQVRTDYRNWIEPPVLPPP
jgi:predicted Rossmann-fold nucleotide-binding protein